MRGRTRRTAAAGAAAFVLAGSASLTVASGTAYAAEPVTAQCGQTVTAQPGEQIQTPFGLQTVTDGVTSLVGGLLGGLCRITVNIVDTAVATLPVLGQPAAGALEGAVSSTTNGVDKAISGVDEALAGKPKPPAQTPPPAQTGAPAPSTPQTGSTSPSSPTPNSPVAQPAPVSPPVLPFASDTSAPSPDYSEVPYTLASLWGQAPNLRYGEVPGLAPASGSLSGVPQQPGGAVANAGRAEALSGEPERTPSPLGVPALAAVVALSAVTAALVRTWVLRNAH